MGEEMEANTCYLGIELNDSYAMVSYMQPNMEEPETVSTIAGSENYRIPTLLARRKNVGMWYYGEDAGRMAKTSEVICVDSLLRRAAASEVITIAKESYDAVDLLALFIKKVIELPQKLGNTSHVTGIVLTVDHLTKELIGIFRHVAELLGLSQETFAVIDDKESFYAFAMNQEKSLWMHDVFLFSCGKNAVSSYDLSRDMHTKPQMITIHATGAQELGEEKDEAFARLLTNCFANRSVSSVYLVGDGFDGEWMKQSLAVLCRGRRAFLGQNLFSKGACYMARIREMGENWPFIYMGENEMKFNLSLSVVEKEKKKVLNLVSAGKNWFEIKNTCEVILSGTPQVEFLKQLPSSSTPQIQTVELEDLPVRPDRTTDSGLRPVRWQMIRLKWKSGIWDLVNFPGYRPGMEKYHNDGINVWVNYYFVMKQLRLCLLYRGNRDKHIFHGRTQLLYFRKCVSSGSFLHVREFMYMGGKTDASCRTRTKTQGEYPHGRKIVRFCFCHIGRIRHTVP